MIRLILVVLFVLAFLTVRFLPWYITLSLGVVLIILSKFLAGRFFMWLFSLPFRAKGKVLRNAKAEVHHVTSADAPTPDSLEEQRRLGDGDDEDEGRDDGAYDDEKKAAHLPRDYYEVVVTITPQRTMGPFHHWDYHDLQLVNPAKRWNEDDDDRCRVYSIIPALDRVTIPARRVSDVDTEEDDLTDDEDFGSKVVGPHRLKMHIGVWKDVRELTFGYYFEKFGRLELP